MIEFLKRRKSARVYDLATDILLLRWLRRTIHEDLSKTDGVKILDRRIFDLEQQYIRLTGKDFD